MTHHECVDFPRVAQRHLTEVDVRHRVGVEPDPLPSPQRDLDVAGQAGVVAVHDGLARPPILLYLGGIAWTLAYDTIYAHQDKDDDVLIGVKSTALKFGASSIYWISAFFILALAFIEASLWLAQAGLLAHMGVAAAALHAAWQISRLDIDDPLRCRRLFLSNRDFGLLILFGLLLDTLL